ncbi:E3 ubiquitin-ligase RNF213-like [Brachionus plicatilis]|uniref:E3 ubiquitin-ligase RNF213-like n=1 Tax=Brachionus plicatilis TaxID=10195 RepID=A0A3M7RGN0_BRAPC|nr:E3 ubiquitin-ligase RNF213-like [Brachionus plicatilis]
MKKKYKIFGRMLRNIFKFSKRVINNYSIVSLQCNDYSFLEGTLNELVKTYKPILESKKEYVVILIHYLCDSSSKNLQTMLDSNFLSADMLLIILDCLVKIAINHFNYRNLESKNSGAELFLLESLVQNQNSNFEIQIELVNLCLIKFHSKAKNSYEHEIEFGHIINLIRKWFFYQLGNSRIVDNYGLGFNEITNKNEPFMFDQMLDIPNKSKNTKLVDRNFTHLILEILSDRLKESSFDHVAKIYLYYNFDILINNKEIQAQFENNLIEKLSRENELISHFGNCLDKQQRIEFLMDKFLEKKFPTTYDPCTICLTSNIYRVILEQMLKEKKFLSPKWTDQFEKIFQSFEKVVNELIQGSIEICKLDFLFDHKENFQVLSNMVFDLQPNCAYSKNKVHFDKIIELINIRKKEWHRFNECFDILVFFLQFCSKSKHFSYGSYKTLLKEFSTKDQQLVRINQFCQPIDLNRAFSDPLPNITYFEGINSENFTQMDQIQKLNQLKLVIFNHFFNNSFREKCELKTVLEEALPNAVKRWNSFAESIDTEKIKLKELEDYLNIHFDKNVTKCLNELVYIIDYFNKPNKEKSKIQIETYFKFRECYKIAEVFRQVCGEFGIRQNFAQLNELLRFKSDEFENFCLDKMDNRVLSMIRTLDKYSSGEKVECLRAFVECKDLIKWIQKNVKDLKELKFLVDLISLTKSSEIQNSTDKNIFAKAFKEATTAYAPLIFEMNADTNFDQFVALCARVWDNLQNDANIAKKLVEIKDKVGVLEDINKKRGNVELSSIEQARQINENGLFKIELLPKHLAIQDMIQVDVTMVNKVNNTQKEKKFNYEKLNELKSILVLLTKKASDFADDQEDANTLDYFIQIFDNCIRLANIFLNMRNNGCDFFNNLKLNLYSDSNNTRLDNQPLIELMFDQNAAISDAKRPSLQILSEICSKMEYFFDLWTKYVEMVRDEYHFINHFTVNQILLVKSCLQNTLDNQQIDRFHFDLLTSMLYNIRSDLEKDSFVDVVKRLVEKTKSLKFKNIFIDKKIDKNQVEKFEKIRLYAQNNGFSVQVVKDAYDMYGNFGEELLNYCLENDSDAYDQNENLEMIEPSAGDHDELVEQTFGKKLERILEKFSQKQNHSSSNNLSMERFAIFLEELYQSGNKSRDFVRDIPGYLIHRGKPNLIVCNQQRDQVEIVLSIYAHSHSAPLPSNDEVLFCNSQTTAEENLKVYSNNNSSSNELKRILISFLFSLSFNKIFLIFLGER